METRAELTVEEAEFGVNTHLFFLLIQRFVQDLILLCLSLLGPFKIKNKLILPKGKSK